MKIILKNKNLFKSFICVVLTLVMTVTGLGFIDYTKEISADVESITLYFIDNTTEKWVKNDDAVIQLVDNTNGHDYYDMVKVDDITWSASVPKSAYNITFNRLNPSKSTQWNSWSAGGRNSNNVYYADGTEYGHWSIKEVEDEYISIYFVDSTLEQWTHNDNAIIEMINNSYEYSRYEMEQVDNITWKVRVKQSQSIGTITFNRYNPEKTIVWNSWNAGQRNNNNTYFVSGDGHGSWGITEPEESVDESIYYKEAELGNIILDEETGIIYVKNQLLISALPGASKSIFESITESIDAQIVGYIEITNDYQIEFREEKTLEQLENIAAYIESFSFVCEVTLNTVMIVEDDLTVTDDTLYNDEEDDDWDEDAPDGDNWGLEALKIPSAWDYQEDFNQVRIGLIDNMFDENHEDLDFEQTFNNNDTDIENNHGTHVAGIMAAIMNNNTGISGVVTDCKLYGYATYNTIENMQTVMMYKYAFALLISKNVKVINVSQNTGRLQCFAASHGNENAKKYVKTNANILGNFLNKLILQGYDFVIVAAAGNVENLKYCVSESSVYGYEEWDSSSGLEKISGNALAYYNSYLNAIDLESVKARIITVGAVGHSTTVDASGNKSTTYNYASFSNVGSRVDVCAPGVDILSAISASRYSNVGITGYGEMNGTSMAAPYISGLAGMLYQANAGLSGMQVKWIICHNTYINVSDLHGNNYGIPNAKACLQKALELNGGNEGSVLPVGILTGRITNSDGDLLPKVKITAYRTNAGESNLENYYTVGVTDENGNYEMILTQGTYDLNIYAEGYLPCVIENVIINPDETIYMENIVVVPWILDYFTSNVDGHTINAINGQVISGATIRFRKGWNNKFGKYVKDILGREVSTKTSLTGDFSVALPLGIYTVEIENNGYITGYFNVVSTTGTVSGVQTMVLTPILSDDEYRIVLTWGDTPSDLDSHLSYYDIDTRMFHVFYGDKTGYLNGKKVAELDLDDTTSYGPETVTMTINSELLDSSVFKYSIHDYTNRNSADTNQLSMSGAVVRVYKGNSLLTTYNVPQNNKGTVWHVFEITQNGIFTINQFEYNPNVVSIN